MDFDRVDQLLREGRTDLALNELAGGMVEENREILPEILGRLSGIFSVETPAEPGDWLNKVKAFIDDYEEAVQLAAVRAYTKALESSDDLFVRELPECLERLRHFDHHVRAEFVDFLVANFSRDHHHSRKILGALVDRLGADDHWRIRLVLLDFFTRLLKTEPAWVVPFKERLWAALLNENDLDLARGAQEFLYHLVVESWTAKEAKALAEQLPKLPWKAMEKVLWLVGKISSSRSELVQEVFGALMSLLDDDHHVVRRRARETIREALELNPGVFEPTLVHHVGKTLENLADVEQLLKGSLKNVGFPILYLLFRKAQEDEVVFEVLVHSARGLENDQPLLLEKIFHDLLRHVLEAPEPDPSDVAALKRTLKALPRSNLYLACYATIRSLRTTGEPPATEIETSVQTEASNTDEAFDELECFIVEAMPDVLERYEENVELVEAIRRDLERIRKAPALLLEELKKEATSSDLEQIKGLMNQRVAELEKEIEKIDRRVADLNVAFEGEVRDAWLSAKRVVHDEIVAKQSELISLVKSQKSKQFQEFREGVERIFVRIRDFYHEFHEVRGIFDRCTGQHEEELWVVRHNLDRVEKLRAELWQIEIDFGDFLDSYPGLAQQANELVMHWTERKKEVQTFFSSLMSITKELVRRWAGTEALEQVKEDVLQSAIAKKMRELQELVANSFKESTAARDALSSSFQEIDRHWGTDGFYAAASSIERKIAELERLLKERSAKIYSIRGEMDFAELAFADTFQNSVLTWERKSEEIKGEIERLRKELKKLAVGNWLALAMRQGEVPVSAACARFEVGEDELYAMVNDLIIRGKLLLVTTRQKTFKYPEPSLGLAERPDVAIFRKIVTKTGPSGHGKYLHFLVKIENASREPLRNFSIILKYPQDLFEKVDPLKEWVAFHEILVPRQFFIVRWDLKKKENAPSTETPVPLEMIMVYRKRDRVVTLSKKVEVLVL
ncbi:MAG: hypothetical protein Kow0069_23530 [Promethearchaeota archaeon]